ncbi:MAG: NAD(P)/FAD-dependent oxidoreductase [Candidatus Tectomicrobia bacterium]|uniref:NAD(P)/FAD-dependent oxidoreductase n=1 Tax=Tectimicrobiota bacterium TaxID=2528274 RepID=A0A938B0Y1_UNCTE|nr:NAD(P)/FAD-dependent oxidoreductase [Candidatus Tectomicrobia bacterium]
MPEAPVVAAPAHVPTYDTIVIGAGISGMFMLYRLRELGMTARVFEDGTDVGGTWYWNRYPGSRFDSESWTYGYSFSKELLQEWDWKEHFSPQPDTLEYLNHVADKFDLRRDIEFGHRVTAAYWDDAANHWTVTLDNGQQARAPFLMTAIGILSAYTLPAIPGRDSFAGLAYHTARWPHTPVDFTGKRVGIIGTGASAIQAIPEIAKQAAHLTVFQRRPNWAAPLHNATISQAEMAEIKTRYEEIYARCAQTPGWFIHAPDPRPTMSVPSEEREAFWEKLYAEPGFGIWMGNFRDILTDEQANAAISAFIAKKIRQRVNNPVVAEKLIPKDHGFGSRRVPLESGYFEAYNRDNVTLVDILHDEPITCITPQGVQTCKQAYPCDMLVYATGFDGVTGSYDRIDIRGPQGRRLKEVWEQEGPRTYLGMLVEGFPNLLMVLGPHTARGNITQAIEHSVNWQTGLLRFMREHHYTRIDTRPEQVATWTETVLTAAKPLLSSKVDSWQTGVNRNVEGRLVRRVLGYNGNGAHFRRITSEVAANGYQELQFNAPGEK